MRSLILLLSLLILSSCFPKTEAPVRFTLQQIESQLKDATFVEDQFLKTELTRYWRDLIASQKIHGYTLEDRKRYPMYCHEQCVCVASDLIQKIKADELNPKLKNYQFYTLRVFKTHKVVNIDVYADDQKSREIGYAFHNLVVIYDGKNWSVFDPIVFINDPAPKSVEHWLNRIASPYDLSYNLFREF